MSLRDLMLSDAVRMVEWMNDAAIRSNFRWGAGGEITLEQARSFIQKAQTDGNSIHRAVANNDGLYMGTVSLKNIDLINGNAEYAIGLLPDAIGKGYAAQATIEILDYAFIDCNLNRVYLNVISENTRAIKFYRKFGFIYEGTFHSHVFMNERFVDLEWYRILKTEYLAQHY